MNIENSKTSEPHRFKLDLTDKLNLKIQTKTWLQPIWIFIMLGKTSSQNTTTINLKFQHQLGMIFDLPDGSYSISDVQDYFKLSSRNTKL